MVKIIDLVGLSLSLFSTWIHPHIDAAEKSERIWPYTYACQLVMIWQSCHSTPQSVGLKALCVSSLSSVYQDPRGKIYGTLGLVEEYAEVESSYLRLDYSKTLFRVLEGVI